MDSLKGVDLVALLKEVKEIRQSGFREEKGQSRKKKPVIGS